MAKVLLIDDNPEVRSLVREALEAFSHVVIETDELTGIIDLVIRESPDVIICDFNMPGKNGYQVFLEIQGIFPQNHFLILTGGAGSSTAYQDDFEKAEAVGITFLRKPLPIGDYHKAVKKALESEKVPAQ